MVRPLGMVRREWKRKGHLGPRSTRDEGTTPKWVPVEGRPSPCAGQTWSRWPSMSWGGQGVSAANLGDDSLEPREKANHRCQRRHPVNRLKGGQEGGHCTTHEAGYGQRVRTDVGHLVVRVRRRARAKRAEWRAVAVYGHKRLLGREPGGSPDSTGERARIRIDTWSTGTGEPLTKVFW